MRWLLPCLIALVLTLGILNERRQAAAERKALEAQIENAAHRNDQRNHELQAKLKATESALAAIEKRQQEARGARVRTAPPIPPVVFTRAKLRKDPAYAPIFRKQQLRFIQRQYDDAIAAMNLPQDEVAKLRDLLLARDDAKMDAQEAAAQAGLSRKETNLAEDQAMNAVNDEIEGLIGSSDSEALQTAPQLAGAKTMIQDTVGLDLVAAGTPLTPDQLATVAKSYSYVLSQQAPELEVADPQTGLPPTYQTFLDQVSPALSPSQLSILKDYLVERVQQQAYFQRGNPKSAPAG